MEPGLVWRKSSFSAPEPNCAEVALLPGGGAQVRDSKHAGRGPTLAFDAGEWAAFVAGVKAGEFDQS